MNIPKDMVTGYTHKTSKYGTFVIVDYKRNDDVLIRFTETGYELVTQSSHIRRDGRVRDPYTRIILGIACKGNSRASSTSKAYIVWIGMIKRCYNPKVIEKHPTYAECTVCEDWLVFECFEGWYEENYPNDGMKYHLDKDIKVPGNKKYSPDTCIFTTPLENNRQAQCKYHEFTNPYGKGVEIYNLKAFCDENNLNHGNMSSVKNGHRKSHKGWTSAKSI